MTPISNVQRSIDIYAANIEKVMLHCRIFNGQFNATPSRNKISLNIIVSIWCWKLAQIVKCIFGFLLTWVDNYNPGQNSVDKANFWTLIIYFLSFFNFYLNKTFLPFPNINVVLIHD